MKPIKTSEDIGKLEPGDMIAMSCPKCKTITVTYVETIKGHIKEEKATQKHLCPGCETTIKTEGRGKQAKDVVVHVCKTCGSEDAFCCVMKKGSGPTKGMEKEKK
jgi:RNase P subunit RPR2